MHLDPGTRLGPYEIQSGIGAGGMGEVYRARDHRLERDVAIKVLPTQFAPGSRQLKQFETEARLLASLNHPAICAIYDVGMDRGVTFIVMEHLLGETLAARIGRGPIPVNVALHHALQIGEALRAAHGANLVHRDIKPGNIMLTTTGIKLLDFGLAKRHMAAVPMAQQSGIATQPVDTGAQDGIVGTLHYMAPEQLAGGLVDARSDIWAFGCVIYEMVAGRRAFSGTMTEVIAAIVKDRPPVMTIEKGVVPIALEHLVARCLTRDPAERWQSVAEVVSELKSMLPHATEKAPDRAAAPPEVSPAPKSGSKSSRRIDAAGQPPAQSQEATGPRVSTRVWVAAGAAVVVISLAAAWQLRGIFLKPSAPLVAVFPFATNGAAPDVEHWGQGLSEGIIGDLAHSERVREVPASVAFHYKSSEAQTAGAKLGAGHVVTGSVEVRGGRLEVEAAVIGLPGGSQLWSGHFSQPLAQAPALQREITAGVFKAIGLAPAAGEAAPSMLPSQVSPEAYGLLLRGWYAARHRDERSLRSAIGFFTDATGKDARLASAFAGMATAYTALAHFTLDAAKPGDAFPNAKSAAIKALELDPSLADAHVALGLAKSLYEHDWQGAGAEHERAVALRPTDPGPRMWRSEWLMAMGRTNEAVEEARAAARLDPLSADASLNLGWQQLLARQYAEAVEQLKASVKLAPDAAASQWALGVAYGEAGQRDEALTALRAATAAAQGQPVYLASLAYAAARGHRTAEARQLQGRLREISVRQYVSPYDMALVSLGLDDYPQAFEALRLAVDEHASAVGLLAADPRLDPLRSDPRFKDLLKRAGF